MRLHFASRFTTRPSSFLTHEATDSSTPRHPAYTDCSYWSCAPFTGQVERARSVSFVYLSSELPTMDEDCSLCSFIAKLWEAATSLLTELFESSSLSPQIHDTWCPHSKQALSVLDLQSLIHAVNPKAMAGNQLLLVCPTSFSSTKH